MVQLAGCHQKVNLTDTKTAIVVSNNISQLKSYRLNILLNKEDLMAVPSDIYTYGLKEPKPLSGDLDIFIEENNCFLTTNFNNCYTKNLQRLIVTTKQLERERFKNYLLNNTVTRLRGNIDNLISNFPEPQQIKLTK